MIGKYTLGRKVLLNERAMSAVEITSLSSKGHVVIPNAIRNDLKVATGDKFAVISDGRNILLKPIERPKVEEFVQGTVVRYYNNTSRDSPF